MLNEHIQLNNLGGEYSEIYKSTRSGNPTAVFGVTGGEKYHIAGTLAYPVIYIVKDSVTARKATIEIEAVSGNKTVYLPAKDDVLLYRRAYNKANLYRRLTSLYEMQKSSVNVVTTIDAIMQLFPKEIKTLTFEKDKEYTFYETATGLTKLGYKRKEVIEDKGDFVIRGDILEIYPINEEYVYKLDFFGEQLEKIRTKDFDTGEYVGEVENFTVITAYDFYLDGIDKDDIKKKLYESVKNSKSLISRQKSMQLYDDIITKLDLNTPCDSLTFIMPILSGITNDFTSLIHGEYVIVFDEPKMIMEIAQSVLKEHAERFKSLYFVGEVMDFSYNQYITIDNLIKLFNGKRLLSLQNITSVVPFFTPLNTVKLRSTVITSYTQKQDELYNELKSWKYNGYRVIICCGSDRRAELLYGILDGQGIVCEKTDSFALNFVGIRVTTFYLGNGFVCHDAKLAVIGTGDLYLQSTSQKKVKKKRNDLFNAPEVGDFAVHETFGIGRVLGTKQISTQETTKEYVEVEYRDGDRLYIPVEDMDKLTKYLGGSDESPQLSKIGNQEFERVKQRVREAIAKMTINLKRLYSERKQSKGYVFSKDNELTEAFDEAFEFVPTEDQIQSIKEIKEDMESDKVMDRLLCGDVGFGKTEVAMRAMFKAVMDGKQVAFVSPTTILSEQHYNTLKKRFEGFGVRIAVLNRFLTEKAKKIVVQNIADGEIDIAVGTHSLFAERVKFNDLGLLVLDEEQRFGVEHKEKLKTLKKNVDTLTMTATPIPRTLHMSLSGIRDISTINTPPLKRIPVQTYVVEESDAIIVDAVEKELSRQGQVFILYNRVESIYSFSKKIRELLPDARIIVAHGQMPEKELETNVNAFYKGEADILISTTIIENGIDLPNANTLIVIDADKLGLSTLYQLKGRVGRSDRLAHAYFTFKDNKVLSEDAYKRLNALMEYSEMGSGYKIAMRDLEIRGAGNVLGREQHGHLDKIGYELYSKLLKEQIGETAKNYETELDVKVSAYIPEDYVENQAVRMDAYKEIAEIKTDDDEKRVFNSIKDNFGAIPKEVENLFLISKLKRIAKRYEIVKLQISAKSGKIYLKDINSLNSEELSKSLNMYGSKCVLGFEATPVITFSDEVGSGKERLCEIIDFLEYKTA